jgi:hypothetical protein
MRKTKPWESGYENWHDPLGGQKNCIECDNGNKFGADPGWHRCPECNRFRFIGLIFEKHEQESSTRKNEEGERTGGEVPEPTPEAASHAGETQFPS